MRKIKTTPGKYYHLLNRGNNKQNIFKETRDWIRFLFLILYFQSPTTAFLNNIGRSVSYFVEHSVFNMSKKNQEKIFKKRYIELISFALMPNHFHLVVKETRKNGISNYMQRALNAYTKYFNAKYGNSGHLFQGPYKIVEIKNNEQLLHLSAYVHRNPRELKEWKDKENLFPWSTYQDYIKENRWGELIKREIVLDQFSGKKEYQDFTETSGAKLLLEEAHLI